MSELATKTGGAAGDGRTGGSEPGGGGSGRPALAPTSLTDQRGLRSSGRGRSESHTGAGELGRSDDSRDVVIKELLEL